MYGHIAQKIPIVALTFVMIRMDIGLLDLVKTDKPRINKQLSNNND